MNKKQIEVEKAKLAEEQKVLDALKKYYGQAANDATNKIKLHSGKITVLLNDWDNLDDQQKSILQSQIYQRDYQLSLKKQLDEILDNLNTKQYKTVEEYLKDSYETGFVGTMYDIHGQGIPLVLPIDQKAAVKAAKLDSKVSKKLYGSYVTELKKRIQAEVSRGVASNLTFKDIARNLNMQAGIGFNKAMRIARTEGHGVQIQAANDAQHKAKASGADVVKQWDAALDGKTRDSHRMVDGQIRELDEKFSNGMMYPSDPAGGAAEVINCRCALLQRARWALDDEELEVLKERAKYFGLDKTSDFEDFKNKYTEAAKVVAEAEPVKNKKEYLTEKKLKEKLTDADNELADLYNQFEDEVGITFKEAIETYGGVDEMFHAVHIEMVKDMGNKEFTKWQLKVMDIKKNIDAVELQKIDWQTKLDKKIATKEIKKLKKEKIQLQDELDNFTVKTYSGIWKDDVTTADWIDKKASIEAKKKYFENKLLHSSADISEMQKWKNMIALVDDFDTQGAAYYALQQQVNQLGNKIAKIKKNGLLSNKNAGSVFTADAYGQRKDDAWKKRFKDKTTADNYYRPLLDTEWNNLADEEKFSVWQYTHNSHPINRPLSGYNGQWGRRNFVGHGNVSWNNENGTNYDAILHSNSFVNKFANAKSSTYGGNIREYSDVISELTTAIDKMEFQDDMWLVRGSGVDGLAGLLDGNIVSYSQVENLINAGDIATLKQLIQNEAFQMHSFTSTGIASGTGFGGAVSYKIYAPKGTKGIYAEPQSYFGNTINGEELYQVGKNYHSVGGEAEVIIQRGTTYRIVDVKSTGYGSVEVTMEVVDQPDYFKTGFEHTFDDGLTSEK